MNLAFYLLFTSFYFYSPLAFYSPSQFLPPTYATVLMFLEVFLFDYIIIKCVDLHVYILIYAKYIYYISPFSTYIFFFQHCMCKNHLCFLYTLSFNPVSITEALHFSMPSLPGMNTQIAANSLSPRQICKENLCTCLHMDEFWKFIWNI